MRANNKIAVQRAQRNHSAQQKNAVFLCILYELWVTVLASPCAEDGSFALLYSPRGEAFTVDRQQLSAPRLKQIWFDPRYGNEHYIHTTDNGAIQTYMPPTSGRGND